MKTKLLFFLILSVLTASLFGQNKKTIDSLLAMYQNQSLDTVKINTANNIVNYYMYRSSDKAKKYAFELLDISKKINSKKGKSLGLYQLGVVYNNLDQLDSAKYYYTSSLELAKDLNDPTCVSKAYRGLAILEYSQGKLNEADSINDMDLENTIKHQDSMGVALAYDFKGTINQNKGYYSIALANALKGLHLFETLGDSIRIADCYNHLATVEHNLGNIEKAINYNEKALEIYEVYEDVYYQAQILNDLGIMYNLLNQEDTALAYLNKSIKKSDEAKVLSIKAASYTNIGESYIGLKKYDLAIKNLNTSIDISTSINALRRIAISENKLAKIYLLENTPSKAITYATNALNYAIKNKNISIKRVALRNLSDAYSKQGKAGLALETFKRYHTLSDSILNKEKIKTIEELRTMFELEKKETQITLQEKEIKTLNVQAENDKLTKTLYGTGMVSFLTISGLLFFGFKQRIKKNKTEREKQEMLLKQEIAFKKKELASQTLHLVQKKAFIQELKENLEKIKKSPELFKVEFRRLVLLLKKENAEDKDWEVFKSYFSEVHNNFDHKLKEIYPDISEKEMRLASFLRMNLSTKEIASMLNVLPDSVLKSKYRLKKKLNLDKEVDLNQYLSAL
ncbi:tetratricopeptide repeat protein [Aquimarina pacifica]|uniref:tetratricopeptide repeat protein n=1 Tax=Aquimarina pacifica TaxID=1296415 RepID=UPI0004723334|nr:tetratricopeptide repeat protein [Aquimarina pacifica]